MHGPPRLPPALSPVDADRSEGLVLSYRADTRSVVLVEARPTATITWEWLYRLAVLSSPLGVGRRLLRIDALSRAGHPWWHGAVLRVRADGGVLGGRAVYRFVGCDRAQTYSLAWPD